MKKNLNFLKLLWNDYLVYFEEINNEIYSFRIDVGYQLNFTIGDNYCYIIDVFNQKLVYMDEKLLSIHHLNHNVSNLTDLLKLIHPDDLEFMRYAEIWGFDKLVTLKEISQYKIGYLMRLKTDKNKYDIFYHQSYYKKSETGYKLINCIHYNTNLKNITNTMLYNINLLSIDTNEVIDSTYFIPSTNDILKNLTKRELEILKLIAKGMTDRGISEKLFLSFNTVRTHRKNILKKSDTKNSIELINKCFEIGI